MTMSERHLSSCGPQEALLAATSLLVCKHKKPQTPQTGELCNRSSSETSSYEFMCHFKGKQQTFTSGLISAWKPFHPHGPVNVGCDAIKQMIYIRGDLKLVQGLDLDQQRILNWLY